METEAQRPERDVADEADAGLESTWMDDGLPSRSARNIADWRAYLPEDCIDTMIKMGWDYST
jgi:hypothetical protein